MSDGSTACVLLYDATQRRLQPEAGAAHDAVATAAPGSSPSAPGPPVSAGTLYCANVGDSRAVLCRAGAAVPLSRDHKPVLHPPEHARPDEVARVVEAGGGRFVIREGGETKEGGPAACGPSPSFCLA